MSAVSRLRRRLAGQEGFTLAELLVVMATLSIVMGGLTAVFVSGIKAEVEAVERFDAQQQARLALGYLRREVHCASGITQSGTPETRGTPPVTYYPMITLTLPSGCPTDVTATGQAIWCTVPVGASRWALYRAPSSPCDATARPHADYLTVSTPFAYTGPTTSSLATLDVDFPVDKSPGDTARAYWLTDRLVLRNTVYS